MYIAIPDTPTVKFIRFTTGAKDTDLYNCLMAKIPTVFCKAPPKEDLQH